MELLNLLMIIRTKDEQCSSSPNEMSTKRVVLKKGDAVAVFFGDFIERRSTFSLGFRPIGLSVFYGARRKAVLRDKDYTWAPIWWSSDNSKR